MMMRSRPGHSKKSSRGSFLELLLAAALVLSSWTVSEAYPVVLQVDSGEDEPRCLAFSIPEDDDAHVVILALPDEEQLKDGSDDVETWYVEQLYQMTKMKSQQRVIPRGIPNEPPDKVAQVMSDFLQNSGGDKAPIKITVQVQSYEEDTDQSNYKAKYFNPLVMNHVRKHHTSRHAENYEGVNICFSSLDDDGNLVNMVLDMVLVSEDVSDLDVKPAEPGFEKEQHLSPLEGSLDTSIMAARQVLKEYKYMEQREQRMRQTADGINSRVHYFSYISVAILFGVTYLQVGYLKRYFKKKKLM